MTVRLYWEDVTEGQEVPPYEQKVGYMELNRFAGANNELVPIHMDAEYAKNVAKLPDVIVMGNLKLAYIAVPIVFGLTSAAILWNFPLTPVRQRRIRALLERRARRLSLQRSS